MIASAVSTWVKSVGFLLYMALWPMDLEALLEANALVKSAADSKVALLLVLLCPPATAVGADGGAEVTGPGGTGAGLSHLT
jgi:hypothetical protein